MTNTSRVRVATAAERELLADYKNRQSNVEPDASSAQEAHDLIESAWVAVFPDYMTDGPGYSGPLLVVVYGGNPSDVETYMMRRGTLERTDK